MRRTVHILLILLLAASGMPLFGPGDVNRDGTVGLEDAIMGVKELAVTADEQACFRNGVENALSSLTIVAGLRTVIKAGDDPAGSAGQLTFATPYLVACAGISLPEGCSTQVPDLSFTYHSTALTPQSPPPRTA